MTAFFFYKGRKDPNTTISWPSTVRQQNAIKMTFRLQAGDGQTLSAGLVALRFLGDPDEYCEGILNFVIFQGGSRPPAPPHRIGT